VGEGKRELHNLRAPSCKCTKRKGIEQEKRNKEKQERVENESPFASQKKGFIVVLYMNHKVLYSTPNNLLC